MGLFKKKRNPFENSAKSLSEKGFCDEYIKILEEDISFLEKPKDILKGESFLCSALIICGHLSSAYEVFLKIEPDTVKIEKLDPLLVPALIQNVIFSLFVREKFKEADELYYKYNRIVLKDKSDGMKRTLAIHEHIQGRYENSVTILAKLLESNARFLDICLIKSMLKLDMFESARRISKSLDIYRGLDELGVLAAKLKLRLEKTNDRKPSFPKKKRK